MTTKSISILVYKYEKNIYVGYRQRGTKMQPSKDMIELIGTPIHVALNIRYM